MEKIAIIGCSLFRRKDAARRSRNQSLPRDRHKKHEKSQENSSCLFVIFLAIQNARKPRKL